MPYRRIFVKICRLTSNDRLVYVDRLRSAGVSEEVARAHAEGLDQALRESVATKSDVEKTETTLRSDITALRSDIEKIETKLDAKIDTTAAVLRAEIAASKDSVLIWMFTFNVALVGAIFAIVKYVH